MTDTGVSDGNSFSRLIHMSVSMFVCVYKYCAMRRARATTTMCTATFVVCVCVCMHDQFGGMMSVK